MKFTVPRTSDSNDLFTKGTHPSPPSPSPSASKNWVNMSTSLACHASGSSSAAVQNAQDMQAVTRDMQGGSAQSVQNVLHPKRWRRGHKASQRAERIGRAAHVLHAPVTWFASIHLWFFHLLLLDRQMVRRGGFLVHHRGFILRRRGGWRLLLLLLGRRRWWLLLLLLGRRRWWLLLLVVLRRWWRDWIPLPLLLHIRIFPRFLLVRQRLLPVQLAALLPILPALLPVVRRLVRHLVLRRILRRRQLRGHGL